MTIPIPSGLLDAASAAAAAAHQQHQQTSSTSSSSPNPGASAPAAPADPYEQVEALLRLWYQGRGWKHPSNIHPPVREQLNSLLRKGQLKRTLLAHPDKFQIRDSPTLAGWEFMVPE